MSDINERPWIENPHPTKMKVPDDAAEWHRMGWLIDTVNEYGHISVDSPIVLSFMGPIIITHYRLSASCSGTLN